MLTALGELHYQRQSSRRYCAVSFDELANPQSTTSQKQHRCENLKLCKFEHYSMMSQMGGDTMNINARLKQNRRKGRVIKRWNERKVQKTVKSMHKIPKTQRTET
jgi:hypothetical protein